MADHFRNLLITETTRLTDLCDKWDTINNAGDEIPDDVKGEIRSTVGCAQLLIAERFKQFSGLIDNNEFNLGEQPTTEEDLQGFWDLVYLQVEDLNRKFGNLDDMKNNEWQEIAVVTIVPRKPKVIRKKQPAKRPEDVNRIKEARRRLAEAKALAAKTLADDDDLEHDKENVKTFDVPPFFSVSSPVKPPLMKTSSLDSSINISKVSMTPKKSSPCPKSLLCLSRLSPALRRALGPIDVLQLQK